MKCPHCLVAFHDSWSNDNIRTDADGLWSIKSTICPACSRMVLNLILTKLTPPEFSEAAIRGPRERMVWPKRVSRAMLPKEIPEDYAEDYREACLVLADSPKASAALSRRCLQHLLSEKGRTQAKNLDAQIKELIDGNGLPPHLAAAIDAVRAIGNFAAHPIKGTNTGEIVPVETGEAEWQLDTLEGLFDFYFVQPATLEKREPRSMRS
jgi:Domain of unknown function (DUF4145)